MWMRGQESQSGVENPSMQLIGDTTQNSCVSTGLRNFVTATVQN
jgi:hypothetical protein